MGRRKICWKDIGEVNLRQSGTVGGGSMQLVSWSGGSPRTRATQTEALKGSKGNIHPRRSNRASARMKGVYRKAQPRKNSGEVVASNGQDLGRFKVRIHAHHILDWGRVQHPEKWIVTLDEWQLRYNETGRRTFRSLAGEKKGESTNSVHEGDNERYGTF